MSYWDFNNTCGLKGVASTYIEDKGRIILVKDPDNPAVLEDAFIVNALQKSRVARFDFCKILPTLLPEEQQRLIELVNSRPRLKFLEDFDQQFSDAVQHKEITSGVRTRLPKP